MHEQSCMITLIEVPFFLYSIISNRLNRYMHPKDIHMSVLVYRCKVQKSIVNIKKTITTLAVHIGGCLNTGPIGLVFKQLPRDLANVNAMKQTCVIVILVYVILFQPNSH